MKKRISSLVMIIIILFSQIATAAPNSVSTLNRTVKVNGRNIRINQVTVNLNDKDISMEVVTGNNTIKKPENFRNMINRKKPVAAINGNFFEAYSDNRPIGTIVNNGKFIYSSADGSDRMISTSHGEYAIDNINLYSVLILDKEFKNLSNYHGFIETENEIIDLKKAGISFNDSGEESLFSGSIGVIVKDGKVIEIVENNNINEERIINIPENGYILSKSFTYDVNKADFKNRLKVGTKVRHIKHAIDTQSLRSEGAFIVKGSEGNGEGLDLESKAAVVVSGGKVVNIIKNTNQLNIPKNGFVIITHENSSLLENFQIGTKIYEKIYGLANQTGDKYYGIPIFYKDVKTAITAWPSLVEDKELIQNINHGPSPKQRAQRSAIGITENNRLLMVTAPSLTLDELAKVMHTIGCVDAMNLDGGASSALYGKGRYLTNAGRNLHTVLMVHDKSLKK